MGGMNSFFSQCDIVKISVKLALQARKRDTIEEGGSPASRSAFKRQNSQTSPPQ